MILKEKRRKFRAVGAAAKVATRINGSESSVSRIPVLLLITFTFHAVIQHESCQSSICGLTLAVVV